MAARPFPLLLVAGLLALAAAPPAAGSGHLAYQQWSGSDQCVTVVAHCDLTGYHYVLVREDDCTHAAGAVTECTFEAACTGAPFSTLVPARFTYACSGFQSFSCDLRVPGSFSACNGNNAFDSGVPSAGGSPVTVTAGSCYAHTFRVEMVPAAPGLDAALLEHTLTLCVSATGPSLS